MQIKYDDQYELEVELDEMGNLESIKLLNPERCLIDLLSPATIRDIENQVDAKIKRMNDEALEDRGQELSEMRDRYGFYY